jgi:penicillin amidase
VGGTFYEVARYTMLRELMDAALGEELANQFMGAGFHPLLMHASEFYGHDTVVLLRILDDPASWWLEQAGGREALIIRSLKKAIDWFRQEMGSDVDSWQWGKIHRVSFNHPLGLQKPLDQVFNRGPFPIGGDTDTPCQTAMHAHSPYDNNAWSPSFRQIVDMGDLSRSVAVIPPGQSGQVGSPHYDDLALLWLKGEYHPMLWSRQQVESKAKSKLILE